MTASLVDCDWEVGSGSLARQRARNKWAVPTAMSYSSLLVIVLLEKTLEVLRRFFLICSVASRS